MDIYDIVLTDDLTLLKKNVNDSNIDSLFYGDNLLQRAIADNRKISAVYLIKKGIDVNYINEEGDTALHYCAARGHTFYDIAKSILKHNGDLSIADIYGNQPLWTATHNSKGRYYDMVELFMEYGADPNHKNNVNKSPLDMVTDRGYNDLIKILTKTL